MLSVFERRIERRVTMRLVMLALTGGARGWTWLDMFTLFALVEFILSRDDVKNARYTLWQSFLYLFHPTFSGPAAPMLKSISR